MLFVPDFAHGALFALRSFSRLCRFSAFVPKKENAKEGFIGMRITFKIFELNRRRNRAIFSENFTFNSRPDIYNARALFIMWLFVFSPRYSKLSAKYFKCLNNSVLIFCNSLLCIH